MTSEEVILKLGLDNSSLKSGMAGADYFVQNSMKATMDSLKNLVRINMVSMAFQAVEVWDKASAHIAKVFYGNMYRTTDSLLDGFRERFRKLVIEGSKSREDLAKASRDFDYNTGSSEAKKRILTSEMSGIGSQIDAAELAKRTNADTLKTLADFKKMKPYQELKLRLLAEDAEHDVKINKLKVEMLKTYEKLIELNKAKADVESGRPEKIKLTESSPVIITPIANPAAADQRLSASQKANAGFVDYWNRIRESKGHTSDSMNVAADVLLRIEKDGIKVRDLVKP